nr:4.9 kDa protein [Cucurbit chlorotic yellows virus]
MPKAFKFDRYLISLQPMSGSASSKNQHVSNNKNFSFCSIYLLS